MICIPIVGPSKKKVIEQIESALLYKTLIEFRFDLFDFKEDSFFEGLSKLLLSNAIITLRSKKQGGKGTDNFEKRLAFFLWAKKLNPYSIDLEFKHDLPIKDHLGSSKILLSFHDFEKTDRTLDRLIDDMFIQNEEGVKIATKAQNSLDSIYILSLLKKYSSKNLTLLAMGEYGQCTRILPRIFSKGISYAAIDSRNASAEGQLLIKDLIELYNYSSLDENSEVFALLGDPVSKSPGHFAHNYFFSKAHQNAVYIKIRLINDELADFFRMVRDLPFKGFSVTMPLKRAVIPFLDHIDKDAKAIGAVNTILKKGSKFLGYNTDGEGALKAISKKMDAANKHVVILGAGGTSRAIAYTFKQKKAKVSILNRTLSKAEEIAKVTGAKAYSLDGLEEVLENKCDILINTTNIGMSPNVGRSLVNKRLLKEHMLVLDCVMNPEETLLIKEAKEKGCRVVVGLEMFINQASLQQCIWNNNVEYDNVKETIRKFQDE